MQKQTTFTSKEDVVAKASDFVIEYKDVQMFSQNYKLDAHVLGEGNQHRFKSLLSPIYTSLHALLQSTLSVVFSKLDTNILFF